MTPRLLLQLTRQSAVLVTSAYVLGFLVITLHHWRFGIAQWDIIRPKALTAGLTVMVLGWFSYVVGSRLPSADQGFSKWTLKDMQIAAFASSSSAWPIGLVMFVSGGGGRASWEWNTLTTALVSAGIVATVVLAIWRRTRGWVVNMAWFLPTLFVTFLNNASGGLVVVWLSVWIFGVVYLLSLVRSGASPLEWLAPSVAPHNGIILFVIGLNFYSSSIYARIKPVFGGGAPIKVSLQTSVEQYSSLSNVDLLEETSLGFYLLPTGKPEDGALFLPRAAVTFVKYSSPERLGRNESGQASKAQ